MDKSCYDLSNFLLKEEPVPFDNLGLADCFAESGNYFGLIDKQGFSAAKIAEAAERLLRKPAKSKGCFGAYGSSTDNAQGRRTAGRRQDQ